MWKNLLRPGKQKHSQTPFESLMLGSPATRRFRKWQIVERSRDSASTSGLRYRYACSDDHSKAKVKVNQLHRLFSCRTRTYWSYPVRLLIKSWKMESTGSRRSTQTVVDDIHNNHTNRVKIDTRQLSEWRTFSKDTKLPIPIWAVDLPPFPSKRLFYWRISFATVQSLALASKSYSLLNAFLVLPNYRTHIRVASTGLSGIWCPTSGNSSTANSLSYSFPHALSTGLRCVELSSKVVINAGTTSSESIGAWRHKTAPHHESVT